MLQYAKAIIAALGAALTAVSGIVGEDSTTGRVITIILAIITTLSVYLVPNRDAAPEG